jgi:pimeloyl-ACP methyl ester carboxylesterase
MSAITTGGELVHYEVLGRGRPVILVHGWLGSWRYWIPTLQVLQTKYRVYALDLYGFGDSSKNQQRYSIEHQTALLDDFMQQLGMAKAALIGHGLGALIVCEFARRYPDRVPRMLVASAPLFDPGDLTHRVPAGRKVFQGQLQPRPPTTLPEAAESGASAPTVMSASAAMRAALIEAARARNGGLPPELESMARADVLNIPNHNPLIPLMESNTADALLTKCFKRSETNHEKLSVDVAKVDPVVLKKSVETFDSGRMLDTLRLLTVPILVVHGNDDPLIPQPNEDILNYITVDKENLLMPILLSGVRHFPMLEDDRFARLANEFLEAPDVSKLEIKDRWKRRTR